MSNSNNPNWSLARDTITLRPHSRDAASQSQILIVTYRKQICYTLGKIAGRDRLQDISRADASQKQKLTARRFAWRSQIMTQSTGQFDTVSIWRKVKTSPICKDGTLPDCLLPTAEIRRNLSLSSLALRNRRPETLKILAKGSTSNWIMGEPCCRVARPHC